MQVKFTYWIIIWLYIKILLVKIKTPIVSKGRKCNFHNCMQTIDEGKNLAWPMQLNRNLARIKGNICGITLWAFALRLGDASVQNFNLDETRWGDYPTTPFPHKNKDSFPSNTPGRTKGSVGKILYFCDKVSAPQIIHKFLYFSVIRGICESCRESKSSFVRLNGNVLLFPSR